MPSIFSKILRSWLQSNHGKYAVEKPSDRLESVTLSRIFKSADRDDFQKITYWLLAIVVPILIWFRAPDAFSQPQFWGEDGVIFWSQWRDIGWRSLWTPYAGYLITSGRLVSALVWPAPYALHPSLYLACATILCVWTAITIATARLPAGLGIVLALGLFLVPHDGEVWASVVNVQWIMAAAIPILIATSTPDGLCSRINQTAFLSAASLTGPFCVMALPLWFVRGFVAIRSHDQHGIVLSIIAILCGLVQAAFIASMGPQLETPTVARPFDMLIAFIGRSGLDSTSKIGAVVGVIIFTLLVLSPFIAKGRWQRASFLIFALFILIPVFVKFFRMPELMISRLVGGRYFFLPSVMIMWVAISLIWTRWTTSLVGVVAVATLIPTSNVEFRRTARTYYPDWHDKSALIDKQSVEIQYPPGWILKLQPRHGL